MVTELTAVCTESSPSVHLDSRLHPFLAPNGRHFLSNIFPTPLHGPENS